MHEWHITEELVKQLGTQAKDNQISRVTRVRVELGKDGHITEDSLDFCFQLLSKDTIANGATLEIKLTSGDALMLMSLEGEQQGK